MRGHVSHLKAYAPYLRANREQFKIFNNSIPWFSVKKITLVAVQRVGWRKQW